MTISVLTGLMSMVVASQAYMTLALSPMTIGSGSGEPMHPVVQPITLESYVREYFVDAPILAEIAKCESTFRHVGGDGKVIRGRANEYDVGVMQINEAFHSDTASDMEIDLHELEGNLTYAKHLYERFGTRPWSASKKCWGPRVDQLAVK